MGVPAPGGLAGGSGSLWWLWEEAARQHCWEPQQGLTPLPAGAALSQASTICLLPELDHPRAVCPWFPSLGLMLAPIHRLTSQPGHIPVPNAPQPALVPGRGGGMVLSGRPCPACSRGGLAACSTLMHSVVTLLMFLMSHGCSK